MHAALPQALDLCRAMVERCCSGLDGAGTEGVQRLSAVDTSLLLRSLASGWMADAAPAAQLISQVLLRRTEFSSTDLLISMHATVRLRRVGAAVPEHLVNSVLSLFSEEMEEGCLSDLSPGDLTTAIGVLAQAGFAESLAWSSVARQLHRLCDDLLPTGAGRPQDGRQDADSSRTRLLGQFGTCVLVALNSAARLLVREPLIVSAAYRWFADGAAYPSSDFRARAATDAGLALVALLRLCAAAPAEAAELGVAPELRHRAWAALLQPLADERSASAGHGGSGAVGNISSLRSSALLLFGLAQLLLEGGQAVGASDAQAWSSVFQDGSAGKSALLRRALRLHMRAVSAALTESEAATTAFASRPQAEVAAAASCPSTGDIDDGYSIPDDDRAQSGCDDDVTMSSSQALTALQCVAWWGEPLETFSLGDIRRLRVLLEAVELALTARHSALRRDGRVTCDQVLDSVLALYRHPDTAQALPLSAPGRVPLVTVELPAAQYFIDVAVQPA